MEPIKMPISLVAPLIWENERPDLYLEVLNAFHNKYAPTCTITRAVRGGCIVLTATRKDT